MLSSPLHDGICVCPEFVQITYNHCDFISATAQLCPENTALCSHPPPLAPTVFCPLPHSDFSLLGRNVIQMSLLGLNIFQSLILLGKFQVSELIIYFKKEASLMRVERCQSTGIVRSHEQFSIIPCQQGNNYTFFHRTYDPVSRMIVIHSSIGPMTCLVTGSWPR